jgi:peptidoglycan/xylan/chitin deacetylase (PgdA/CDA1 family)
MWFGGRCRHRPAGLIAFSGKILISVGIILWWSAADARSRPLHEQCWSAAALAGRDSEKIVRRQRWRMRWTLPKVESQGAARGIPRGVVRRVALPRGLKLVALTFDLCESSGEISGYDGAIVDYLRRNRVPATFFAGGKWIANHDERAQQLMADPLFEVANHSWSHRNLRRIGGTRLLDEIVRPTAAYAAARARLAERRCAAAAPRSLARVPRRMSLFRFPYGVCNAAALKAIADAGMIAIQWDVVTGDPWRAQTARLIAATVLRNVRPGSIVVAHANGRGWHTAGALPIIVPRLRRRGYRFVTVSELLAAGRPVVASSCYEHRPGDNLVYDHPRRRRHHLASRRARR